jgi:hypothetical protein
MVPRVPVLPSFDRSSPRLLAAIAELVGARRARLRERVQTLWAGYGELLRVEFEDGPTATAIVKLVRPPAPTASSDRAHTRKLRSYDVETVWYHRFAPRCDARCRVAALLGSRAQDDERLLVLEDLDAAGFSKRTSDPAASELDACLAWLAALHARFLAVAPEGLWETGTYWHVATRPDELARTTDPALRDAASRIDALLEGCTHRTILHGDAKEENFCFGPRGVAAVDFQYAGGGCGMKDVAYLLYGRWGSETEARALGAYFRHLRAALAQDRAPVDPEAVEREWRALYPLACADFCRFLAGWAPAQWARDASAQARAREALAALR